MSVTFENLINNNKRNSTLLVVFIVFFTALVAGVFGLTFTGAVHNQAKQVFILSACLGAGLSFLCALISFRWGTSIIAGLTGAREVQDYEDKVLINIVEEMSIAAGLKKPPKIYAIWDESPNAFATGASPESSLVCVTTGLREKLTRDELQAVIAHEIAHIKNYDTRLMMLVGVFAGVIVLMSDFFLGFVRNSLGFGGAQNYRDKVAKAQRTSANVLLFIIIAFMAVILAVVSPFIAKFLQLAISREREYLADATAVKFCRNPLALASALKKIALDKDELDFPHHAIEHMFIINPSSARRFTRADLDTPWSTHPPLIKRIARLQAMASDTFGIIETKKESV